MSREENARPGKASNFLFQMSSPGIVLGTIRRPATGRDGQYPLDPIVITAYGPWQPDVDVL
jgi:hypothetical protein